MQFMLLLGVLVLLFVMSHFLQRLITGIIEEGQDVSFYDISSIDNTHNKPGELLRAEHLESAPDGIDGWRVLYRSTDKDGDPIIASGLVAAPSDRKLGEALPVVSWGHPTTGIAPRCAPSSGVDPFDMIEGLRSIVAANFITVAADYSGMGVAGPQSFLIGESEGRTMLDIVRAASQIPNVETTKDVAFWGHSQGGHAALFASQISPVYAPELLVRGVAVAAPATNLAQLIKSDIGTTSGVTIGSYAFYSYSHAYDADLDLVLSLDAKQALNKTAPLCLLGQNSQLHAITQPLIGKYLTGDPETVEPWATILKNNTPQGPPIGVSLFVAQGQKDTLIEPSITLGFVEQQQRRGIPVMYVPIENSGHGMVALDAVKPMVKWLQAITAQ